MKLHVISRDGPISSPHTASFTTDSTDARRERERVVGCSRSPIFRILQGRAGVYYGHGIIFPNFHIILLHSTPASLAPFHFPHHSTACCIFRLLYRLLSSHSQPTFTLLTLPLITPTQISTLLKFLSLSSNPLSFSISIMGALTRDNVNLVPNNQNMKKLGRMRGWSLPQIIRIGGGWRECIGVQLAPK